MWRMLMRAGAVLLLGCAPAAPYLQEGRQTVVEVRLVKDTTLTDSWQARGEVLGNGVVVTFSRTNPCRYPVPSARVWRNGATIHLLPEWSIPDPPRPCPDELALEHYQARLTGLAPGEYTILVHGTADEERPSFPPIHVRVGRR